jgi:hypothetical protein
MLPGKIQQCIFRLQTSKIRSTTRKCIGPITVLNIHSDLPTTDNTTIATFADDTVLLAIDSDPALASQKLQQHLDLLQEWFDKWKIKINQTKSSQITFTTKRTNCPPSTINNIQIPVQKGIVTQNFLS